MRAPAVPLINCNPNFNIWSNENRLNEGITRHWSGVPHPMTGVFSVNGKDYLFMGNTSITKMEQITVDIDFFTTEYIFNCDEAKLAVRFTTPLLLNRLNVMARPITYIEFEVLENRGGYDCSVKFTIDDCICLQKKGQAEVVFEEFESQEIVGGFMENKGAKPLQYHGDRSSIDWGRICLASAESNAHIYSEKDCEGRTMTLEFSVNDKALIVAAYDELYAIEYYQEYIDCYWKKEADTIDELIKIAINEYDDVIKLCNDFKAPLEAKAFELGGEKYVELLKLAYRQTIAAHTLCEDKNGNILFISRECGSGAHAATVDVTYPSMPLFLLYNPELVVGMIRPIFRYALQKPWKGLYTFAPHDAGFFPILNGQTYPLGDGLNESTQMPVEECGNMLLICAAIAVAKGGFEFGDAEWELLKNWRDYLIEYGADPGEQLCTDDFAGHLAHNCNLSVKAIMGIAAYAILCNMRGNFKDAETYIDIARSMAKDWIKRADNGDGTYRLVFDKEDTFSMKYNAIWDMLFGTNIFPKDTFKKELKSYVEKRINRYGMPLDNRNDYTKSDWILWVATMMESKEDFEKMIVPLWRAYDETRFRWAMCDLYFTSTADHKEFENRTVQGGLFMKLLADSGKMKYDF